MTSLMNSLYCNAIPGFSTKAGGYGIKKNALNIVFVSHTKTYLGKGHMTSILLWLLSSQTGQDSAADSFSYMFAILLSVEMTHVGVG